MKIATEIDTGSSKSHTISVMNAQLAAQRVLYNYYPVFTHATEELSMYMDSFFDCLNGRNQIESIKSGKDFLAHTDQSIIVDSISCKMISITIDNYNYNYNYECTSTTSTTEIVSRKKLASLESLREPVKLGKRRSVYHSW